MSLEIQVVDQAGPLPPLLWRWDAETDILTGAVLVAPKGAGYTGTVELNDESGSVALLDVTAGVLCGIDIVVWPDITTLPGLSAPVEAREGKVVVPQRAAKAGVASLEFDTILSATADPDERTIHLRVGARRPVEPIRVADHFLVEIDDAHRLAGFWLEDVPPSPDVD